jgi:tRNA threonylcarbamoyladenosine biosynthesis protein TsaE
MPDIVRSESEADTIAFGRSFALTLTAGDVVALYGGLGSGKTQFVKGVCAGLGAREHVTSPTFTLINEYRQHEGLPVFHLDLYRMKSIAEIAALGIDEYMDDGGVTLIEWAEKAGALLPRERIDIHIRIAEGIDTREIVIHRKRG